MAKAGEVLEMLCSNVEYVLIGEEFDDIDWLGAEAPISKSQYEKGFEQYDAWKAEQDAIQASSKKVLLEKLGITEDEAKLLLN